jgi:hypothetical protein
MTGSAAIAVGTKTSAVRPQRTATKIRFRRTPLPPAGSHGRDESSIRGNGYADERTNRPSTKVYPRRADHASKQMTAQQDIASVAVQLAELTRTVEEMAERVSALSERADTQREAAERHQERANVQQDRIDIAARELAEVSERLQNAADALRHSM